MAVVRSKLWTLMPLALTTWSTGMAKKPWSRAAWLRRARPQKTSTKMGVDGADPEVVGGRDGGMGGKASGGLFGALGACVAAAGGDAVARGGVCHSGLLCGQATAP